MLTYRHGGERFDKNIRYDFSVNVNPLGMPPAAVQALREALERDAGQELFSRYPDDACLRVRQLLAQYLLAQPLLPQTSGASERQILCGNGASELIFAAAAGLCRGGRGMLFSPCFLEYERAFAAGGAETVWYDRRREQDFAVTEDALRALREERPDLLILCQPGNPMGEMLDWDFLRQALRCLAEFGGVLLLDVCFLPFTGSGQTERAAALYAEFPNLLLLGALTKTCAMAGLRFGYLIGREALLKRVRAQLPAWNVSAPAQLAAQAVLEHPQETAAYWQRARELLRQERPYLEEVLRQAGLAVRGGAANFLFCRGEPELYAFLLEQGILLRQCANYRGLDAGDYRVAVRRREETEALREALQLWRNRC